MIFSKKTKVLSENDLLLEEQSDVKSNISYLESQYDVFILKSLELEFPMFKESESNGYGFKNWNIDDVDSKGFNLLKGNIASYAPGIKIKITHNGEINKSFSVSEISCETRDKDGTRTYLKLNRDKFKDVVFKYILSYKISKEKASLKTTKKTFEFLTDFLGKDVHRDGKIDEILK